MLICTLNDLLEDTTDVANDHPAGLAASAAAASKFSLAPTFTVSDSPPLRQWKPAGCGGPP
jgi:hypothetical protein